MPKVKSQRGIDKGTRNRIVAFAREKFFSLGFVRVTMDEIAYELGMSKKTLYQYFPSKVELLREVSKATLREIERGVDGILGNDKMNYLEKLTQWMTFLAFQISRVRRCLLEDLRRHAPEIWKEINQWRHESIQINFGNLVAEGLKKGIFKNGVSQPLLVLIYTTLIEGIINPEILSQLPLSASQAFDTIIKVIFEGILTDRAKAEYQKHRRLKNTKEQL